MKKYLIFTLVLFFSCHLSAQQNEQFVRSYTKALFKEYNEVRSEWDITERFDSKNTFVFNYNNGNDVKVYFSNGKEEILTRVSKVVMENDIQCIGILSDKGEEGVLCLTNEDVLLIYGKLAILFYN